MNDSTRPAVHRDERLIGHRSWAARWVFVGCSIGIFVGIILYAILVLGYGPADGVTYLAAGERLNAGHPLYALSPGDRPIDIRPPYWTVPLLSPPLIAVIWRPLAALPGEAGLYIWWAACAVGIGSTIGLMLRARPVLMAVALFVFLVPFIYEIPTGNVNGLLLFALVAVWLLVREGHDRGAGVVLAVAAVLKLTPAILVIWLLVQRRWHAVAAFVITAVALALLSLIGAGLQAHLDYLHVIGQTASAGSSRFSLAGVVRDLGVATEVARFAPLAIDIVGVSAMWALRRRPEVAFSIAVFTMVWGSPVVNMDWLTLLLVAMAPGIWPLARARPSPTRAPEPEIWAR
ncbi:MAG: glycosyltransferase family 87 protein [Candidatus Limnocylindrales bacterium]